MERALEAKARGSTFDEKPEGAPESPPAPCPLPPLPMPLPRSPPPPPKLLRPLEDGTVLAPAGK